MITQSVKFAIAATGVLLLSSTIIHAQTIAYDAPSQPGNQSWPGNMGLDFDVTSPITILKLGAFDNNGDGFTGSVNVAIFSRTTGLAVTPTITFSGIAGTLVNGDRFIALPTPVALPPGQYSIVAVGYNGTDLNGNAGLSGITASTMNTGGGSISFTGTGRYDANTTLDFPQIVDSGPLNRYLAGTFQFAGPDTPATDTLSNWWLWFFH